MTLPISSSEAGKKGPCRVPNKALAFLTVKRFIWLPILNTILLFFSVPFLMLVEGPRQVENFLNSSRMMQAAGMTPEPSTWFYECTFGNPMVMIVTLGIGLLWAAVLFNYLNENKAVNFFHSLPLHRGSLFANLCLTGALAILAPILIVAGICLLLLFYRQFALLYTASQVLWWALCNILMVMTFFSSAVMMGMITGQPLVQPVFAVIFNILPVGLYTVVFYLLQLAVYGFPSYYSTLDEYFNYLPFFKLFNNEPLGGAYCLLLAGLTVLFLTVAWLLYRRRPLESTGDIIVFPVLRPIFKYGVTFCVSLCGGILTMEIMEVSLSWWPLLLWAVVGYAIAEMLLQKSVRILSAWKGLAVYCLIFIIFLTGLRFDVFGYESRLPEADQVAFALLNRSEQGVAESLTALEEMEALGIRVTPQFYETMYMQNVYQEPANIQALIKLQENLVGRREELRNRRRYDSIFYVMKDGSVMRRQYQITESDYPELIGQLKEARECRIRNNTILLAQPSDIAWMTVGSGMFSEIESPLLKSGQVADLLAAYQKDLWEEAYAEMDGERAAAYTINLRYVLPQVEWEALQKINPRIFSEDLLKQINRWYGEVNPDDPDYLRYDRRYESLPVYGSYLNTLAWLKEQGLADSMLPEESAVASVRLYEGYNYLGTAEEYSYWLENYNQKEAGQSKTLDRYDRPAAESYPELPYEEKLPETLDPGIADSLSLTEISDRETIRRILTEGGFSPYFRLLGEKETDRRCWHIDFVSPSDNVLFTGFYYDGLPSFLAAAGR